MGDATSERGVWCDKRCDERGGDQASEEKVRKQRGGGSGEAKDARRSRSREIPKIRQGKCQQTQKFAHRILSPSSHRRPPFTHRPHRVLHRRYRPFFSFDQRYRLLVHHRSITRRARFGARSSPWSDQRDGLPLRPISSSHR